MKEENATSIEYFRDFRRVADLINGVIFHGKPVVRECDLQEQNPVLHNIFKKDNKVSAVENTLDLFVMVTVNKAKFLLMLQGQTIEHYVMPVRVSHERETEEAVYRKPLSDFEMRHFSNEEWFQTDLRQVLWLFEKNQ